MRVIAGILILFIFYNSDAQNYSRVREDAYGYLWAKQFEKSIESFTILEEGRQLTAQDHLQRGHAFFNIQNYDLALQDFNMAREANLPEAALWLSKTHLKIGQKKEAIELLKVYISSQKVNLSAALKDISFQPLHEEEEWFKLWELAESSPIYNAEQEISFYIRKRNFSQGHHYIDSQITDNVQEVNFYLFKAQLYEAEQMPALALNEINRALQISPGDRKINRLKAQYLVDLGKYYQAISVYSELLTRDYPDFEIRLLRAKAALESGNYQLAEEDIDLVMRYSPDPENQVLAAGIYSASGNYTKALLYLNPILEADQSNAEYFKQRGIIYNKTRLYKQAAYDLSMSLDLVPDDPEVNYELSLSYAALNDQRLACYYLNRAADYGSDQAKRKLIQTDCSE